MTGERLHVLRFADFADWYHAFRSIVLEAMTEVRPVSGQDSPHLTARSPVHLCLAGGATPMPLYSRLVQDPLFLASLDSVSGLHLWIGDERAVPPDSPERNGRVLAEAFSPLLEPGFRDDFPHENRSGTTGVRMHLWPESSPSRESRQRACLSYSNELLTHCGPVPEFDLALFGLGTDGHTAGLFPQDPDSLKAMTMLTGGDEKPEIECSSRCLAVATTAPFPPRERMSLTLSALGGSKRKVFLLEGSSKEPALQRVLSEEADLPPVHLSGGATVLYLCG